MILDYAQLDTLAAILRLGSFEAAAAHLGITPSAVSQRIRALEERIGTVLVERGQPCTGTDTGRRLAAHADTVGLLETSLARDIGLIRPGAEAARIRLAVNADSLATWLIPALTGLPDSVYDLVVDDQDHSADWLHRGEVVAAITAHARPVVGCDSHPLGAQVFAAAASPAFVETWFAGGLTAATLARAPMLQFNTKDLLQRRWLMETIGSTAAVPPTHLLPSSQGFVDAMRAGLGWGMAPELLLAPHLASGALMLLRPGSDLQVPLYWQINRHAAAALKPLTRAILRQARGQLAQSSASSPTSMLKP